MYAAPTSLTAVKSVAERSMSAPRPRATTTTWEYAPTAFPSTVATAARRPSPTPRLMTKSTLGPGTTISAKDVTAEASREPVQITTGRIPASCSLTGVEAAAPYGVLRLDEVEGIHVAGVRWKPVRRTLGIEAFGINAYSADEGQPIIEEHNELGGGAGGHEEVYI